MKEESVEILQKAIDIEVFGYDYYKKIGNSVDNKEGKALLIYLANAEEEHKKRLESMLNKFGGVTRKTDIDTLMADILMDEGIQKIFKGLMKKEKFETVDAIEALKLGMEVEAKSIDFYNNNAEKSPESDIVSLFTELSNWEKEHLEILSENVRSLKDEGVWYGYVPILEG